MAGRSWMCSCRPPLQPPLPYPLLGIVDEFGQRLQLADVAIAELARDARRIERRVVQEDGLDEGVFRRKRRRLIDGLAPLAAKEALLHGGRVPRNQGDEIGAALDVLLDLQ